MKLTDSDVPGKHLGAPLLISSMTGGTELAGILTIALLCCPAPQNNNVGSQRVVGKAPGCRNVCRAIACSRYTPICLGAVQLNYDYGLDECLRVVDLKADALIFISILKSAFT